MGVFNLSTMLCILVTKNFDIIKQICYHMSKRLTKQTMLSLSVFQHLTAEMTTNRTDIILPLSVTLIQPCWGEYETI